MQTLLNKGGNEGEAKPRIVVWLEEMGAAMAGMRVTRFTGKAGSGRVVAKFEFPALEGYLATIEKLNELKAITAASLDLGAARKPRKKSKKNGR